MTELCPQASQRRSRVCCVGTTHCIWLLFYSSPPGSGSCPSIRPCWKGGDKCPVWPCVWFKGRLYTRLPRRPAPTMCVCVCVCISWCLLPSILLCRCVSPDSEQRRKHDVILAPYFTLQNIVQQHQHYRLTCAPSSCKRSKEAKYSMQVPRNKWVDIKYERMKVEGVCGFSPFAPVTTPRCCRCPVGLKPSSWFLKGHFGRFSLFEVGKSWESFFFSWKRGENRCGQGRGILTFQSRELASRMLRSLTFLVRDQIKPEDLRNVLVLEVIERVCAETHPCETHKWR